MSLSPTPARAFAAITDPVARRAEAVEQAFVLQRTVTEVAVRHQVRYANASAALTLLEARAARRDEDLRAADAALRALRSDAGHARPAGPRSP